MSGYVDPNANKPGYYLNYDTGTWMPVQNIVPMSPYPPAPPAGVPSPAQPGAQVADPNAGKPGYVFSYDTGTWIPTQNIVPQSPYPVAPPAGVPSPAQPVAQSVQPVDTRPGKVAPPAALPGGPGGTVTPAVPTSLAPTTTYTGGVSNANPNAANDTYAPTNYGMNRNPMGNLGNQQALGRSAVQPNTGGLGQGTNTNNPRNGIQNQPYNPVAAIPTGERPLNPYHGGVAAPALPSYAVPNGRPMNSGLNPYQLSSGLTAYNPGSAFQRAPAGSGVAYVPAQHFPMLQGLSGQMGNGNLFGHPRGRFGGY